MEQEIFDGQRDSADVIIIDALHPEEGAMSQAVYSRKPKSVLYQLLQVLKKGAGAFMSLFYSNYGHNSIGDCGSTTLYFENVSMLAAKALQNWPLYSGQEASTRYLDFSNRVMINPLGGLSATKYLYVSKEELNENSLKGIAAKFVSVNEKSGATLHGEEGRFIQEAWMDFYNKNMPIVKEYVSSLNPKSEEQDQTQYDKSVNARAFDIMRGFIPAGMTTLVSWHSNVRQLRDHLAILKYHPSDEISKIAQTALAGLIETYPSSFVQKERPETEAYLKLRSNKTSYYNEQISRDFSVSEENLSISELYASYMVLLEERPKKTEVPHEIGEAGTVNVKFLIDFGSFRDAQRHRKGVCKMPLLTTKHGFNQWYLDRLPEDTKNEALALIKELENKIENLPCSEVERQYYIPMGYNVVADFTWTIDQCIYVAELRSSDTVHPTFRVHAQSIGKWLEETIPFAKLYVDYTKDKWSYKRGSQDIIEKV